MSHSMLGNKKEVNSQLKMKKEAQAYIDIVLYNLHVNVKLKHKHKSFMEIMHIFVCR